MSSTPSVSEQPIAGSLLAAPPTTRQGSVAGRGVVPASVGLFDAIQAGDHNLRKTSTRKPLSPRSAAEAKGAQESAKPAEEMSFAQKREQLEASFRGTSPDLPTRKQGSPLSASPTGVQVRAPATTCPSTTTRTTTNH